MEKDALATPPITKEQKSVAPTVMALFCATCWIGLVLAITVSWFANGGRNVFYSWKAGDWGSNSLSITLAWSGMWHLFSEASVFALATIAGIVSFVRRKKDKNPRRVNTVLAVTLVVVIAALAIAANSLGLSAISSIIAAAILPVIILSRICIMRFRTKSSTPNGEHTPD